MDPALLRDQQLFKKRAIAVPVIENRQKIKDKQSQNASSSGPPKKKIKKEQNFSSVKDSMYSKIGTNENSSFGILRKIVLKLKKNYLDGCMDAIDFNSILDETNQLDMSIKNQNWLITEALPNNKRIKVTVGEDGVTRYAFKPPFPNLKDRSSLKRLLNNYDMRGKGGIDMDDVIESLPNAERIVKQLADRNDIVLITRPDKKKILFARDNGMEFKVDEEFQKHWRSVAVDGIDEQKIEDYLEKNGITSMRDVGTKKITPIQKRKKPTMRKNRITKKHNDHMTDVLDPI